MAEGVEEAPPTGPLSERLVNKNWKWRLAAYEELEKVFQTAEDGNSRVFNEYGDLFKKILADSNAIAQEKGLDPLIAFVDRCDYANKHAGTIAPLLVEKCLGSARPKTKDKAVQGLLMLIEADGNEPVVEALTKGCSNKVPKISAASISTLREALRLFGAKVIPIKPIMKEFPAWFENRDKAVRTEAQLMVVEMRRWLGKALDTAVEALNPVQAKELQAEFEKLPSDPVAPVKYMRSQAPKPGQLAAAGAVAAAPVAIDPYDLMDAVNVLTKIKEDWFESLGNPKWQIRNEAIDKLIELCNFPRLEQGDYAEVAKSLKKCLGDANVVVVSKAAKAIGLLGAGLRSGFSPHAKVILPTLLEKLKEKKLAVMAAINETLDIFADQCFPLLDVMEDLVAACANKVPQVREGTLNWIARAILTPKQIPNVQKCVKPLANMLVQVLDDGTSDVRDAAAKTFGTLSLVVGERAIQGFIAKLDPIKQKKVKDSTPQNLPPAALAALAAPPPPAASEDSNSNGPAPMKRAPSQKKVDEKPAAPKKVEKKVEEEKLDEKKPDLEEPIKKKTLQQTVSRPPPRQPEKDISDDAPLSSMSSKEETTPRTAPPALKRAPPAKKAAAPAKPSAKAAPGKPGAKEAKGKAKGPEEDLTPTMTKEEATDRATALAPSAFPLLGDKNWKQRLAGIEELGKAVDAMSPEDLSANSEAITLALSVKPGWKESNFQVLSNTFLVIGKLAKLDQNFSRKAAGVATEALGEKLADIKLKNSATECLLDFTEATCPQFVFSQLYQYTVGHKNPKVTSEALTWMVKALEDFGTGSIDIKMLIEHLKSCLESTNAPTKTAATKVLVVLRVSVGPALSDFLTDVKKQLLDSIEKEFEKVKDAKPNPPTRTFREAVAGGSGGGGAGELPRTDISGKIKEKLLKDLGDAQFKTRQAALEQIEAIVLEANRRIEPKIGSLMGLLKARLSDSNQKVLTTTLYIISLLGQATGPQFDKSAKIVIPAILGNLADNKKPVRDAAVQTMDSLVNEVTLEAFVSFLPAAMASDSSVGRKEVLTWLMKYMPAFKPKPTSDLAAFIKPLLACLQDKQSDVRQMAEQTLGEVVRHVGADAVKKECKDLKPAVQQQLNPILDKLRGPAKPTSTMKPADAPAPTSNTTSTTTTTTTTTTTEKPAVVTATSIPTLAPKLQTVLSNPPEPSKSGSLSARSTSSLRPTTPIEDDRSSSSSTSSTSARSTKSASPPKSRSPTRMKAKVDDSNLILLSNDQKEERSKKERKLKWAFDEPRQEFIDSLKEQAALCVSTAMHVKMFAADFRLHQKALDDLLACIEQNKKETIENLDVILKWITIRLFDTNLTSLRKTLSYLEALFAMLGTQDFHLSDYEANVFIPLLIDRSGANSSEPIKLAVRGLFKQLCNVYPSSKTFRFVLDGLKSKNWRTRVECLDELSSLINRQGLAVCAPAKALPSIATHLADRDPSVRTSALNTFLQAYTYAGEDLWRYVAGIPENQRAMLEAHFKRDKLKTDGADGTTSSPARSLSSLGTASTPSQSPVKSRSTGNLSAKRDGNRNASPAPSISPPPKGSKVSSAPKLDFDAMETEEQSPIQQQVQVWMRPLVASDGSFNNDLIEIMKVMALAMRQATSYIPFVDRMVLGLTQIGSRAFNYAPPSFRMCKYIFNTLGTMFNQPALVTAVSQEPLMKLFELLAKVILEGQSAEMEDEGKQWMNKASNQLLVSALDNCDIISAFTVLLRLMTQAHKGSGASNNEKFTEMVTRCLLRLTKRLISTAALFDWSRTVQLLKETNAFLVQHPTGEDMTIRAVKTMLNELVRAKGAEVLDHLVGLPTPAPVVTYLQLCVKNQANTQAQSESSTAASVPASTTAPARQPSPPTSRPTQVSTEEPSTPSTQKNIPTPAFPATTPQSTRTVTSVQTPVLDHETKITLRNIFKNISNRETTQQGINELYQFKKANPNVDLSYHMSQSSEHFQQYIKRALDKLEAGPEEAPADELADTYLEKLRNLQSRHGMPKTPSFTGTLPTPLALHSNTLNTTTTTTGISISDIKQRIMRSAADVPSAVADKENTIDANVQPIAPQQQQQQQQQPASILELKQRIARIKGT